MRYDEFVRRVAHRAAGGLDQEQAERAIRTTLGALAEQIPGDAAADLAAQLPKRLKAALRHPEPAEPLPFEEFLHRIAERQEVSGSEALHRARAVMSVLAESVTGHELGAVRAQLGEGFDALFRAPAAMGWPESRVSRPHP